MSLDAVIAGIGIIPFGKFPNRSSKTMSEEVTRLALNDANIETREIDREILETIKTEKYNQTVQLIYNHPVFAPAISNARCNSLIREIINGHDFGAVTNNPPTIGINNAKWKLNEIKVPTLVVIGRNDSNYFHITAETLKNGIADSQLKITEDAGHMLNMEQPHTFNQILSLFLSTH